MENLSIKIEVNLPEALTAALRESPETFFHESLVSLSKSILFRLATENKGWSAKDARRWKMADRIGAACGKGAEEIMTLAGEEIAKSVDFYDDAIDDILFYWTRDGYKE